MYHKTHRSNRNQKHGFLITARKLLSNQNNVQMTLQKKKTPKKKKKPCLICLYYTLHSCKGQERFARWSIRIWRSSRCRFGFFDFGLLLSWSRMTRGGMFINRSSSLRCVRHWTCEQDVFGYGRVMDLVL